MFISTIGSSIQPIYAASSARINPDDMLTVLNDITVAGQSWENIGFDSEDIANIMQMQRKDDSYYASLNTDIARLSVETVETKALENAIAGKGIFNLMHRTVIRQQPHKNRMKGCNMLHK